MTRSPFTSKPNTKPSNQGSLGTIAIVQLVILCACITLGAAIFVQNFPTAVQIFFLGQKTIAIPLSVAMLVAFIGGGILALVINAIASWRHNLLLRRAVVAAGYDKAPQEQGRAEFTKQEFSADNRAYDEYEEEGDEYEEEEDEYEEDDEEEEDDDPDTVPYGDRLNIKSRKSDRPKRDRPPLDAKFIK
ncbi:MULTISPECIES: LapA family protein [Pseudanabaena]|uniref:Lipopolysaccharide assembly protein A domain-containing protein n=2 Tax=Pseudanabaena TaxID=1152 RepID=L8N3A0_9CYAN|nr:MULTISPECIES: LapA family protein [Pseudanabaena]ELS34156.1 hypothetical protein Pse7429DRAFT_0638 [Pseudanabaena biceps PCC 7429]MDG3493630.1 LapA family protein [Pseudanabaena catenata USMAC16]